MLLSKKDEPNESSVLNSLRSSKDKRSPPVSGTNTAAVVGTMEDANKAVPKEETKAEPATGPGDSTKPLQQAQVPIHAEEVPGKKLLIEVKEGSVGLSGKVLEINAHGLVDGPRKQADGIVYFGNSEPCSQNYVNDFAYPRAETGLDFRHFKVFYSPKEDDYYIQDLGEGTGTFVKIERESVLGLCTTCVCVVSAERRDDLVWVLPPHAHRQEAPGARRRGGACGSSCGGRGDQGATVCPRSTRV